MFNGIGNGSNKGVPAFLERFMSANPEHKKILEEIKMFKRNYRLKFLGIIALIIITPILLTCIMFLLVPANVAGMATVFLILIVAIVIIHAEDTSFVSNTARTFNEEKFPNLALFMRLYNTAIISCVGSPTISELEKKIDEQCIKRIEELYRYEKDLDPKNESVQKFRDKLKSDLKVFSETGFWTKDWKARFKDIEEGLKLPGVG